MPNTSETDIDYTSFNDDMNLVNDLNDERDRMTTLGFFLHVTTTLMIVGVLVVILVILF
jgi:hypothetical protein